MQSHASRNLRDVYVIMILKASIEICLKIDYNMDVINVIMLTK